MSSASQPAPEFNAPIPRTRLKPIGGTGKSSYIAAALLAVSVIGALVSGAYSKGRTGTISVNVYQGTIQVDNSTGTLSSDGSVEFQHLPYGTRSVHIYDQDHQPLSTTVHIGLFSDNRFAFQLIPVPLTLRVNTLPGAQVLLNGHSAGTANNQGVFVKDGIMPGDYRIQVTLAGYTPFEESGHWSPRAHYVNAWLRVSQERVRQMDEEQRRAQENATKIQQLLGTARQAFNSRQYKSALASVDEALRLEPSNAAGQQLKAQIVQTMNILK